MGSLYILGRSDIVMKDRKNRQAIVMEAKHSGTESVMDKDCDAALCQIEKRGYAKKLERSGFSSVIRYGVVFYQKWCLVKVNSVCLRLNQETITLRY
jgi:hypothetical protein